MGHMGLSLMGLIHTPTVTTFAVCFLLYLITQIHQWQQWENGIQKDATGNGIRI
jgi:hypothetical protein